MSDFVNDIDALLDQAPIRNVDPRGGRAIVLAVDPAVFHVNRDGVGTPTVATFTASLVGLTGEVQWSAPEGVTLRGTAPNVRYVEFDDFEIDTATILVSKSYRGEMYAASQTISKVQDGSAITTYTWIKYGTSANGANFSDNPAGATYIGLAYNKTTPIESDVAADYQWVLIKGQDGIGVPGAPGADGQTLYTWIKYSDNPDGTALYDLPVDSTMYIGIAVNKASPLESTAKTDYVWSKFRGDQGVAGQPGAITFTWIKYASSSTGAALSDSPDGKAYIGFAYNKFTPVESTDPADYQWALLRGEDGVGVPGAPGADGITLYTWIKYSNVADGTGLYDIPNDDTVFIGIAVNKPSAAESANKADYVWSKFKGAAGVPGRDGDNGARGNVNIAVATQGNVWSDNEANIGLAQAGYGQPKARDVVALFNVTSAFVSTKIFTGEAWTTLAAFFDGALLVKGTVYTDALVALAVTADKIAASAITAAKIAAEAITAEKIAAEAITAEKIRAGAVTARALRVGSFDNVVPDPNFEDPAWWGRPTQARTDYLGANTPWKSRRAFFFNASNAEFSDSFSDFWEMTPGATYKIEYQVYISGDFNGAFSPIIHLPAQAWYTAGQPGRGYSFSEAEGGMPVLFDTNSAKGFFTFTDTFVMGNATAQKRAQARLCVRCLAGYFEFGGLSITRMSDNTLITDDGVTTPKLAALAVVAEKIASDAVQARHVASDTMEARHLKSDVIQARHMTANSIETDFIIANGISSVDRVYTTSYTFTSVRNFKLDITVTQDGTYNAESGVTSGGWTLERYTDQGAGYGYWQTVAETFRGGLYSDTIELSATSSTYPYYRISAKPGTGPFLAVIWKVFK